ncbi:hypothetical protein A9W98_14950 [Mycobacterium gordonae]|uniref:DUF302 domain-containing protein n=2 Tax=Mycobacterium gordonae TaxID=1778 RepID=A0A1A6BJB0_MYCGO|nr:hypothetical protein A9W98_14950 [Mycobacterium gordonae]
MLLASRAVVAQVLVTVSVALTLVGCHDGRSMGPASAPTSAAPADGSRNVSTKFVNYTAAKGFEATVDALNKAAADHAMMIVGEVNEDAELAANGLRLPGASSFFVGNPGLGKKFFDATKAIGAVVPVRMHVWVDGDGPAHIGYFDPAAQFTAVDPALGEGGQQISQQIRTIAEAAAGGPMTATAVDTRFITVSAGGEFEATIGALHDAADKHGMVILGDLNEETRLQAVGVQSQRAHSFFIGDPRIGKTLFGTSQAIGAVVPVRVTVWSNDRGGPALISYFDPAPEFTAVDPALTDAGSKISDAIRAIVDTAAGKP